MRVLVTGYGGQLGYDVCKRLDMLEIENKGVDIADFDLTNAEQVDAAIQLYAPDCVVHCAAYTAVDKAETNREICMAVNVAGTRHVAESCQRLNAKMIYISTDYVFNGAGELPFEVDDTKAPLNVYGESKWLGEQVVETLVPKHFIVRTAWVFGQNGNNFVKTMLRLGREKSKLNVVCDQVGSPTYTPDLAALLCDMLQTEAYGIYHATNEGFCSWAEFAKAIMEKMCLPCKIHPVLTSEYPASVAKRPFNSRLSKTSLVIKGFDQLPSWQDALQRYLVELE